MTEKNSTTIGLAIVAVIIAATAYFLVFSSDNGGYKSKLVPEKGPGKIHHPWTSGKKDK